MNRRGSIQAEAVIFGGGAAGLWLLDELTRRGCAVLLLEAHDLGSGQTAASQGIIHGGLKYTLGGMFSSSARSIRNMPAIWRDCLAGRRAPDLRHTRIRAEHCHLWRTETLGSRLGMIGAKVGLRVTPVAVARAARPAALANCPGTVQRLDEPVIDPSSLIADLAAQHRPRILKIDAASGLKIVPETWGFQIIISRSGHEASIDADRIILTAGAGNQELRRAAGLPGQIMQRRPLHMVMVRGPDLPALNGHCVDGARTRLTITSDRDARGRTVWLVGGQLAEDGVAMDRDHLIEHARHELRDSLGGFDAESLEWSTYRIDRAEAATTTGTRPDDVAVVEEETRSGARVITAWPTKLALAPRLAEQIADRTPLRGLEIDTGQLADWPRPSVAKPPWETEQQWSADA